MKIASRLSYVTDWGKRGLKKMVIHIMTKVAMQASPRPTAKPWMKLLFCFGFFCFVSLQRTLQAFERFQLFRSGLEEPPRKFLSTLNFRQF